MVEMVHQKVSDCSRDNVLLLIGMIVVDSVIPVIHLALAKYLILVKNLMGLILVVVILIVKLLMIPVEVIYHHEDVPSMLRG